ncbi:MULTISPECIES: hypothetical protein [Streptomyces]|uniref:Uncharacterized protein n=1 Tax=Streptomyces fradiae ATCC 10745 = DSM 40063 TaxID=1319510 RepID=A0A1Y2NWD9_STRFR|nr:MULTISPECIES: hypothetical protein [Streptomyces]KAF0649223.1 hypothetical protein K701_14040 [Streptomyces fradiae ATCC 10745 = DSM 40063]OSY51853.1 hypothetical protein BG846_02527 [Streptomyces fradiae ATCC 10745 = DSM 40063]QEV12001.1 hypothetical protein CP974_08215 [Streptomyces fradiae ATCC 10745 = DSM 40063]
MTTPARIPEITTTMCRGCGSQVSGLNGRYACGVCGWVNNWAEGHTALPTAEEDPDWPGPDAAA